MQKDFAPTDERAVPAHPEPNLLQRVREKMRVPTRSEVAVGVAVLIAGIAVFAALTSDADLPAS